MGMRASNRKAYFTEALKLKDITMSEEEAPQYDNEIEEFILSYPGVEYSEISLMFNCSVAEAREAARKYSWLVLDENEEDDSPNDELDEKQLEILETLRIAGTLAYPLSTSSYDDLVSRGLIKGLSAIRIHQIFGSWRIACSLAGVEAPPPVHEHYDQKFTESELVDAVARFVLAYQYRGAMHNYDTWRESLGNKADEPSSGTLRNYLGPSWRKVRSRGLRILREKWLSEQDDFLSEGE
jgi:hypothetical protein